MKKLYRSRTNKTITGLLGGIGEYLNVDPVIVRIVFILLLIVSGIWPAVLVYLIAWLVVPLPPEEQPETKSASAENDEDTTEASS